MKLISSAYIEIIQNNADYRRKVKTITVCIFFNLLNVHSMFNVQHILPETQQGTPN